MTGAPEPKPPFSRRHCICGSGGARYPHRERSVTRRIERWLKEDYPRIAKEAKQEQATIYWGDEMGLRSDHVSGTSFALKGETPCYVDCARSVF